MNDAYNSLQNNIITALDQVSTNFQLQVGNDVLCIIAHYTYSNVYNFSLHQERKNGKIRLTTTIPTKVFVQTKELCRFINDTTHTHTLKKATLSELELCIQDYPSSWNKSSITFKCNKCIKSMLFNIVSIKWDGGITFTVEPFIAFATEILTLTIL